MKEAKMRRMTSALLLLALAVPASAEHSQSDLKLIAARYVEAQEAVMEKDAGPAQVDALLAFYTDDFAYHHPQFGATVRGRDNLRKGISSHLGETSDAEITVKGILRSGDILSVSTETRFTNVADRKTIVRPGIMVLTFKDGRIVQRVDI